MGSHGEGECSMVDVSYSSESLQNTIAVWDNGEKSISDTRDGLTSALTSAQWTGPRAEEFRTVWAEQCVPALNSVLEALGNYRGDIQMQLQNYLAAEGQG